MISHRLAFAACADHIIILSERGEVVEKGDPKSLLRQNSIFANLHAAAVAELTISDTHNTREEPVQVFEDHSRPSSPELQHGSIPDDGSDGITPRSLRIAFQVEDARDAVNRSVVVLDHFIDGVGAGVIAGYLGQECVWERIDRAWKEVLSSGRQIQSFDMNDWTSLHGRFDQWSRTEADVKHRALLAILEEYGKQLVLLEYTVTPRGRLSGLIDQRPFDHLSVGLSRIAHRLHSSMQSAHSPIGDYRMPAEFTLDRRAGVNENILSIVEGINDSKRSDAISWNSVVGSLRFTSYETSTALQCSNLLAWHAYSNSLKPNQHYKLLRDAAAHCELIGPHEKESLE